MRSQLSRLLEHSPAAHSIIHWLSKGNDINRRVFVNCVRPGDVVIEIGANVGSYTGLLSRLVKKKGRVYAFEPMSENFEKLEAAVHRQKMTNVVPLKTAVGATLGEVQMQAPSNDLQQSSIVVHRHGSWQAAEVVEEQVQMTTLDDFAKKWSIEKLDMVKVDTEGAELLVLQGGEATLERHHPLLHLEINDNWLHDFGITASHVFSYLKEIGYQRCYAIDGKSLRGFRELDSGEVEAQLAAPIYADFLFRH